MRSDLFDLEGMTALVTGGTRGIGRGIVEQFVRHGARVALSSRSQADCDAVVAAERERAGDNVELLGIALLKTNKLRNTCGFRPRSCLGNIVCAEVDAHHLATKLFG